jgi:hypothetical protein
MSAAADSLWNEGSWRMSESSSSSVTPTRDSGKTSDDSYSEKVTVYRVVVASLLASMLWKFRVIPLFYSIYASIPLHDSFFPAPLRHPTVLAVLFILPIVAGVAVLFISDRKLILMQSLITVLAMFGLCIHQATYNDVTFLTCFWAALWCGWFALRMDDPADLLFAKGSRLVVLIFSVIFLGGAVGKLTPGYWSGEVFYHIYFTERNYWVFNLLRANFEPEALRSIATYYSRMVIGTELACAFLWLLPSRWACAIGVIVFSMIALMSNTNLFSVMGCLLGLGLAGMHGRSIGRAPLKEEI